MQRLYKLVFCVVAATLAVAILDVTIARIEATQNINLLTALISKQLSKEEIIP